MKLGLIWAGQHISQKDGLEEWNGQGSGYFQAFIGEFLDGGKAWKIKSDERVDVAMDLKVSKRSL